LRAVFAAPQHQEAESGFPLQNPAAGTEAAAEAGLSWLPAAVREGGFYRPDKYFFCYQPFLTNMNIHAYYRYALSICIGS